MEFLANGRWLVISPSDSSIVWRRPNGQIATAQEIHDDPAIFRQIYERDSCYPYLFDRWSNIRWEKLPPLVRAVFRFVLGEKRYDTETPTARSLRGSVKGVLEQARWPFCSLYA